MKNKNLIALFALVISALMSCSSKNGEARYNIAGTIQNAANQKLLLQEIGIVYSDYIADLPIYRFTEEEKIEEKSSLS
jgi:hypothetical protein